MNIGHVQGGTNAGWRTIKAAVTKADWICPSCGKSHRYYWTRCPVDGTQRPEREG